MNYPFLILSFFVLCCFLCFMTLPVMAAETTETTWEQDMETTAATTEPTMETTEEAETEASTEENTFIQEPFTENLVPEEYEEPAPDYVQLIQDTGSSIIHADLFGAFLICGTLVGIFLLRGRYGT